MSSAVVLGQDLPEAAGPVRDGTAADFATIIPVGDNKFAALNTAVWSGSR